MTLLRILMISAVCAATLLPDPLRAQTSPEPAATYLDQGWSEAERRWWYTTSQGSRLLPLAWMAALEQKDCAEKFLADPHIGQFGYLPSTAAGHGLPLGFAVDQGAAPDNSEEPWVGMTCAACHTGEFAYAGKRVRIDGAPALADFQSFMESLLQSLVATRADTAKLVRFVNAVLGAGASADDREALIASLDRQIAWFIRLGRKNATPIRYGYGRLDAQGHILNKIALSLGAAEPLLDFPSDAPASYPFLWTTPQHKPVVQWNGIAPQPLADLTFNGKSYSLGAMLRNTTELIGVFGSVDAAVVPGKQGYASSLRFENMIDLEALVSRLKSPRWPENILPPIDQALAGEGRAVYLKHQCNDCHSVIDPASEPPQSVEVRMVGLTDVGTDIWLACNAYVHESKSGILESQGQPATAPTLSLLVAMSWNVVSRAQSAPPPQPAMEASLDLQKRGPGAAAASPAAMAEQPVYDDPVRAQKAKRCRDDSLSGATAILAYKARPLNGIWATAPYLHNGSVPTLYQLLLPPNRRTTSFRVGGKEFDPKDVGFKSGPADGPFELRVRDDKGEVIPGNDNAGHDYGTASMTERERRSLVEYLKTL